MTLAWHDCSCRSSYFIRRRFHTAALRSLLVPSEHNAGAQGEPGKHLLSTEQPHNITQCLCDEAAPHIGEEHMGVAQPTRGTYRAHIHSSEDQSDRHEDPITTHGLVRCCQATPHNMRRQTHFFMPSLLALATAFITFPHSCPPLHPVISTTHTPRDTQTPRHTPTPAPHTHSHSHKQPQAQPPHHTQPQPEFST